MTGTSPCTHLGSITTVKTARRQECDECVKSCDNSPNRHATTHARVSGHPVIASAEPGERWLYCYPDDAFAEY